jgi:hypothetical protein
MSKAKWGGGGVTSREDQKAGGGGGGTKRVGLARQTERGGANCALRRLWGGGARGGEQTARAWREGEQRALAWRKEGRERGHGGAGREGRGGKMGVGRGKGHRVASRIYFIHCNPFSAAMYPRLFYNSFDCSSLHVIHVNSHLDFTCNCTRYDLCCIRYVSTRTALSIKKTIRFLEPVYMTFHMKHTQVIHLVYRLLWRAPASVYEGTSLLTVHTVDPHTVDRSCAPYI